MDEEEKVPLNNSHVIHRDSYRMFQRIKIGSDEEKLLSPDPHTPPEESGPEIALYNDPILLPTNSSLHIASYIIFLIYTSLIATCIYGIIFVVMYSQKTNNFVPIIAAALFVFLWRTGLNFYYWRTYGSNDKEMRLTFFFEILQACAFSLLHLAFLAFLVGSMDCIWLPYFNLPLMAVAVFPVLVGLDELPLVSSPLFLVFESIQTFYLSIKLSENSQGTIPWFWVLAFYNAIALLSFLVSIVVVILGVAFLILTIINRKYINRIEENAIAVILLGGFYLFWNGISYYFVFFGVKEQLETNGIGPGSRLSPLPRSFLYIGLWMFFCSLLTMAFIFILIQKMKGTLRKMFTNRNVKDLSITSLARDLYFFIEYVSTLKRESFTRRSSLRRMPTSGSKEERVIEKEEEQQPEICNICKFEDSEVLLEPCHHNALCKNCYVESRKKSDTCPFCKKQIDQAIIVSWDPQVNHYKKLGRFVEGL